MLNFLEIKQLKSLLRRLVWIWNSPTLMTWGSFLSRSLTLVVVLPLILTKLKVEEISLWYLFSSIIGLQLVMDAGFSPTFSRLIAYAMGGLGSSNLKDLRNVEQFNNSKDPDWITVESICSTMRVIYLRLAIITALVIGIFGTLALFKPISSLSDGSYAWIAWSVILLTSTFTLLGNTYSCYLQGINQVALLRRWEIITSLASIGTSTITLLYGGGLLGLVVANQSWLFLNIWRNRYLCRQVENGRFQYFTSQRFDPIIFEAAWSSAWRSGLGVLMGYGIVQISGLLYAQVGTSSEIASYLLALRLIQTVSQFSQAPFYSKLPLLARLRSTGNLGQQIHLAKRGFRLAYWTYAVGFIGIGILISPLLRLIGSNAEFVSPLLWGIMGMSMFAERYGAMHLQLYSITNHIIWHIANGVSGIIYITFTIVLFKSLGVYAFPVSSLLGSILFYCWYCAKFSYRTFSLDFFDLEYSTTFYPLVCISIYVLLSLVIA